MDMVERCAKAAYEAWIAPVRDLETEWDDLPRSHIERLMDAQRAAIAAMREPTDGMIERGFDVLNVIEVGCEEVVDGWRAMIDAALGELGTK